jgi:hypothetical protein
MAAIHRQVVEIAKAQARKSPSYDNVRQVIKKLVPALVTMAHQGAAAYREEFDLLYRRESSHSNAMWQADHCELPILLLDEVGKPDKPWLTAIEDDYSRMIVGYRLSFQPSTTLTTALALRLRTWLLSEYHARVHVETHCKPQERWEAGGFLPRTPTSLEQLDLLLLTVAKTRRVQQDGIRFQGYYYIDPTLAGYVKEEVVIQYDPADLAVVRVFHQERFVCRAICQELSGQTVSLKEIEKARSLRRKQVREELGVRAAMVDRYVEIHYQLTPERKTVVAEPAQGDSQPPLKRYD